MKEKLGLEGTFSSLYLEEIKFHPYQFFLQSKTWIAMWYGYASSKLVLHVLNQTMLKSNGKSRSIGQGRHVNTNWSSLSFFRFQKDYRPRKYDKSNKTLPNTQTRPSCPLNIVSQNFLLNEHLTSYHWNKTYKTETGLNRHKAKCKERDKPSDNEHNIPSTSNDNNATVSLTIDYPWSQTGNTILSNTINKIYTKVVFWNNNLFLLPSYFRGKRYIEETTMLLNKWIHDSPLNGILFKTVMLMSNLLLQKPSKNCKSKDHQLALERCLELWHKGEFEEL